MIRVYILFVLFSLFPGINLFSQENRTLDLKDLATPNSPAFVLTDITPTLIQNPNTPKTFVLGVFQSFQQNSGGFPQNYSSEFCPYWWLNKKDRSVYSAVGLKTKKENGVVTEILGQNPWSGLKFTSVSIAFLNNDLVPDTLEINQKVFSFGARSTIYKIYQERHVNKLKNNIDKWHKHAFDDFSVQLQTRLARTEFGSAEWNAISAEILMIDSLRRKARAEGKITDYAKEINNTINEKPVFSWDIAAAYAAYGLNDSVWRSGRSAIWTTISTYLPLDLSVNNPNQYYLNLNLVMRYLRDNFSRDSKGEIGPSNNFDFGGKAAIEISNFSIGIESLYRFSNGRSNSQNRTVGVLNYKIADNIFLNGAFGKNFDFPNRLIALFGVNWGIGKEKVEVPGRRFN